MSACTSIFSVLLLLASFGMEAHAQTPGAAPVIPSGKKEESTLFDQYSPYLDYGDFNSSEDEDADTLYFQYGRFFGVSLGAGYQAATGNRGLTYQPAFPRFDFKIHYWFDYQFAMAMGIWFGNHTYNTGASTAALLGYYADLRYYFDVRDAAAAITFANPHLILGVGAISKTVTTTGATTPSTDSTMTVSFGAGLEFPISYKKTYFILDARYWTESFQDDTPTTSIANGLSGGFFSLMGHLMFTW